MAPIKAYPKLVHLVTSPDPEEMPVTSCDFNCFPCHIFGDWNLGGICCFGGVRRCLESKRKSIINLALTVFFFQTALPHVHSGMSAGTMPPDSCCAQMLKMLQWMANLKKNMTDKIHFKFHLGKTGGKNLNQQKTWFPKANSGNNHKKRPLQTQKGPPHSGLPQWPFTWSSTDSLLTCHQAHTSTRTSRAQAQKMIHASTSHGQHNSPGTPSATSHGVLSASPGRKTHGAAIVWADDLCYAEYTVLHHDTILQEKINNPFVKCLFGAKRTILKCSRKTLQKHAPLRVKSFNVRIA